MYLKKKYIKNIIANIFNLYLLKYKFLSEYTSAVIKGWSGFKLGYAKNMLLLGDMSPEDEEKELEFSKENVEVLMKNSNDFDTWVTEQVGDLENFTQSK